LTYRLRAARYHGVFAELLEHDVARRWLDEAHGWFDEPQRESPAARRAPIALVETPFGLGVAHALAASPFAFRRRRRALRLFHDALHLGAVGVPTAQPYAALLPRRRGDPAALVVERVDAPSLAAWAAAGARMPEEPGPEGANCTHADLARAIADTLARMHRSGLHHRGLDAGCVLVEPEVPGIVVAGLDGIRRKRLGISRRGWRARARDLVPLFAALQGLGLERDLWQPLLARYCERTGDDAAALDAWIRRIRCV
jgi:hypothetical protein